MAMVRDFQSFAGPGDRDLKMTEVEGYQPVSRIGEVVMNAFIDSYEFASMQDTLTASQMSGKAWAVQNPGQKPGRTQEDVGPGNIVEYKPAFHEWATTTPGMICLARKKKTAVFRAYVAAETAIPVISCAACLPYDQEKNYFFAGIARSKSVRGPDDGVGPTVDEFFTLSLGGMVTVLNTSGGPLHAGDLVEWTFLSEKAVERPMKRQKSGPRRIGIKMASASSPKVIGRALSFGKSGEPIDILLKQ